MSISRELMKKIRKRDGDKCSVCGGDAEPLELHHIIPISQGGDDSLDNLRLVCSKCHRAMHGARRWLIEAEFADYLFQLLKASKEFRNVKKEVPIGKQPGFIADLVAEEYIDDKWQKLVIECKASFVFTMPRLYELYAGLRKTREYIGDTRMALAFPGELSGYSLKTITELGIEIWDLPYLAYRFRREILKVAHPVLQSMLMARRLRAPKTPETRLIAKLKSCKPGMRNWVKYERLIGSILERLFCPPLEIPMLQLSDTYGVSRRDFILPNYAEEGFWAFLRSRYSADYIVAEAKNHKDPVEKRDALQMSNYLKEHGVGLFGLIICRNGSDRACEHTLREAWAIDRKLIIILTDHDITQMLLTKLSTNQPEIVIRQKIEDFRLSL